jgi:hypothetical protein
MRSDAPTGSAGAASFTVIATFASGGLEGSGTCGGIGAARLAPAGKSTLGHTSPFGASPAGCGAALSDEPTGFFVLCVVRFVSAGFGAEEALVSRGAAALSRRSIAPCAGLEPNGSMGADTFFGAEPSLFEGAAASASGASCSAGSRSSGTLATSASRKRLPAWAGLAAEAAATGKSNPGFPAMRN